MTTMWEQITNEFELSINLSKFIHLSQFVDHSKVRLGLRGVRIIPNPIDDGCIMAATDGTVAGIWLDKGATYSGLDDFDISIKSERSWNSPGKDPIKKLTIREKQAYVSGTRGYKVHALAQVLVENYGEFPFMFRFIASLWPEKFERGAEGTFKGKNLARLGYLDRGVQLWSLRGAPEQSAIFTIPNEPSFIGAIAPFRDPKGNGSIGTPNPDWLYAIRDAIESEPKVEDEAAG